MDTAAPSIMWSTKHYCLHDLTLEVKERGQQLGLAPFLQDFSFFPTASHITSPSLSLSIRHVSIGRELPANAREVFRFEKLSGHTTNRAFYLKEGPSLLHIPFANKWGEAFLTPDLIREDAFSRQRLLGVGLVKLLRSVGYYALHAAGLLTAAGKGVLISGISGCGKSTLTIGMIRHGWRYLSDDAILLRVKKGGVNALVFRQPFSIDSRAAKVYEDLPLGKEPPPSAQKQKRRLNMREAFPTQHVPECIPRVLLFPKIISGPTSRLEPLTRTQTIGQLLGQSNPEVFDRPTMEDHLHVLTKLVKQCENYELQAGQDLYQQPSILEDLLAKVKGTT